MTKSNVPFAADAGIKTTQRQSHWPPQRLILLILFLIFSYFALKCAENIKRTNFHLVDKSSFLFGGSGGRCSQVRTWLRWRASNDGRHPREVGCKQSLLACKTRNNSHAQKKDRNGLFGGSGGSWTHVRKVKQKPFYMFSLWLAFAKFSSTNKLEFCYSQNLGKLVEKPNFPKATVWRNLLIAAFNKCELHYAATKLVL